MAIKRRERDNDGSKNFQMEDEHIPTDHELFLQAFEKPTQIYRYLRTRNAASPIFLHRSLNYMRDRMSRNHTKRKTFKVDSLLPMKDDKEKYSMPGNYMTLMFLGFYNKGMLKEQHVEVKLTISKISHLKRKDSRKSEQDHLGSAIVKTNPVDMIGKVPAISVPSENFKPAIPGSSSHSCNLHLEIKTFPDTMNVRDSIMEFECDLVIYDKHNRFVLTDGEYDICVEEKHNTIAKSFSPKKHATWEIIPENYSEEFSKIESPIDNLSSKPTIKFRLSWTKDKSNEYVDRPLPITIRKEDHFIANKENKPEHYGNENGTITTSTGGNGGLRPNGLNNNNNFNNNNINNNKNLNNINATAIIKLHDIASRIIYHFIYNNNSSQQTEAVDNFNCPWCSLHCMTLYSLLKHLKLCHARFNFTYVPMSSGVRVDVSINNQFDGSYSGSPHDLVGPAGSAFSAAGPVRRTTVTRILVCHPRRAKPSLHEFLELDENELNSQRPYITGHTRQYHHTMTSLPIFPKELENDSEDENDPAWLQHKTMQMIDEFTDVNEGEKELMKMWNLHIMRKGYVGDIQIPLACDMFLDERGQELLKKNLYKNFVLHLCNLFDYGLLSADVLYKTIQKSQRILSAYNDGRDIMSNAREQQMDYWLKVGVHRYKEMQAQQQAQQPPGSTTKRKIAQSSAVIASAQAAVTNRAMNIDVQYNGLAVDVPMDIDSGADGRERKDGKTRLDFNDHKSMDGPIVKKIAKSDINSNESSMKRRKSTILPAHEEEDKMDKPLASGLNKKKNSSLSTEIQPRRRSLTVALSSLPLSASGSIQNVSRRNSFVPTSNLALRKAKRL